MYPTMVTALVYSQRTMVDNYHLNGVTVTGDQISNVAPSGQNILSAKSETLNSIRDKRSVKWDGRRHSI